ncbi:MAG TPA: ATP-binding protein [Paenalcaligenes sp.]|nr:ATP-binding protein [Paenalcaligenes sp.]
MARFSVFNFRRKAPRLIRWVLRIALTVAAFSAVALLVLLAWSTGNASRFAEQYDVLLIVTAVLAVALLTWVLILSFRLWRQTRRRQFGARMTARFALYFTFLGILPGILIYVLSVQFMSRSIESWFNVRVDSALEAGINLGREALDAQLADLRQRGRGLARRLEHESGELSWRLGNLREQADVPEALVFTSGGRLVAFSSASSRLDALLPEMPSQQVLNHLRVSNEYQAIEVDEGSDNREGQLRLRVVLPLPAREHSLGQLGKTTDKRWLQVTEVVPEALARQASLVQEGYSDYQELALSRDGLQRLFSITLTLALIVTLFAAVVAAIGLSRRLVRPLLTLASGTQAVGVGDYRPLPETQRDDEIGQLTRSFNVMTRQLDEARQQVEENRAQLERTNVYLEAVLRNLSAGVLVFDEHFKLSLYNQGAEQILQTDLGQYQGQELAAEDGVFAFAAQVQGAFDNHLAMGSERRHWQQQFELPISAPSQLLGEEHSVTLLARGTELLIEGVPSGYLVVFDDISDIISANRLVAWGEVARRLAHEIKNPLTPIQLSAERLALRLADHLDEKHAAMLQRSTQTIVNQVASLKKMVEDFREYARKPATEMQLLDINELINEVLSLYGWDPDEQKVVNALQKVNLQVSLQSDLPPVAGDPTQLRQVLHNIFSNAVEALSDTQQPCIVVRTAWRPAQGGSRTEGVRLVISDNGPGFDEQLLARVFEPYITTKDTGTGLGLAIVRKIVEEHGGRIDISNRKEGGARISILFTRFELSKTNTEELDKGETTA